jgi:RNA polymerase sigma-70 factor (ECF subfamily)
LSQGEYVFAGCTATTVDTSADEVLVERLRSGDSAAYDQLYAEYHRLVFNLAFRFFGEREEASDVSQEVYMSIFRHVARFSGASTLKTWIYRITLNTCLNRNRWWNRRMKKMTVPLKEVSGEEKHLISELRDTRSSPEESAFRSELGIQIQKVLNQLPKDQRAAVILRDLEGLSYDEIAEALGVSLGTVKSRIARGREQMRLELARVI